MTTNNFAEEGNRQNHTKQNKNRKVFVEKSLELSEN